MWKLAIEDDQGNRTVVNLVRDEYSIGRAEENTVRLTERNISRHHAKLSRNGTGWILADASSDNGCFLNGARVDGSHKLEHGDLLQLGDYRLELVDETLRPASAGPSTATVPALPRTQSLVGQPDRLVMLVGPAPGAEFPITGTRMVLGRGEDCDLPLNHSSVSRVHAEMHALGDGHYEIIDRESANGLRVNGVELKRALLDARDTIELGDLVLKFIPAGEIYRPGSDDVHQIGTNGRRPEPSPAPGVEAQAGSGGVSSGLKIAAGLLALAALVLLGMLTLRARPALMSEEPPPAPFDPTTKTFAEARVLLDRGDVEAAHQKIIDEIPVDSNARQAADFREIEARWADKLFADAQAENDVAQKRAILERIAKSASVDSVRRKRAASDIATLDLERINIADLPSASVAASASAAPKPTRPRTVAQNSSSAANAGTPRENATLLGAQAQSNAAARKAPSEETTDNERQRVARAKAILQTKANAGRATEQEMRMLHALCRQLGDTSCSE